jgi:hypothetical protein
MSQLLNNYLLQYDNLDTIIVFNFNLINGGIGDMIKFFLYLLKISINNNIKIKYLVNNIFIEKYLKLKNKKMYIKRDDIKEEIINIVNIHEIEHLEKGKVYFLGLAVLYNSFSYNIIDDFSINEIFEFSDDVISNANSFLHDKINNNYISIHLRLGDKFLETDEAYIFCKEDVRNYNEKKIFETIEKNYSKNIIFFCDNISYKKKIKNKYDKIFITDYDIGHTTLLNTTDLQVLNSVSEFYLITNSEHLYAASGSGFSIIGSKFNKIPITNIY